MAGVKGREGARPCGRPRFSELIPSPSTDWPCRKIHGHIFMLNGPAVRWIFIYLASAKMVCDSLSNSILLLCHIMESSGPLCWPEATMNESGFEFFFELSEAGAWMVPHLPFIRINTTQKCKRSSITYPPSIFTPHKTLKYSQLTIHSTMPTHLAALAASDRPTTPLQARYLIDLRGAPSFRKC